ncbi:MAG TPA: hypothetical protein VGK87_14275 [Anaerolineae bacterium]
MMVLQIYFNVSAEYAEAFERMYADVYAPALRKQQGYVSSRCIRVFAPAVSQEIGAEPTSFNYQLELVFDTEANRRLWAASDEHTHAWPLATALAQSVTWRGYDIVGSDR